MNGNPKSRRKVENGDFCLRVNENGVDLNRNWDEKWAPRTVGYVEADTNPGPNFDRERTSLSPVWSPLLGPNLSDSTICHLSDSANFCVSDSTLCHFFDLRFLGKFQRVENRTGYLFGLQPSQKLIDAFPIRESDTWQI